MINNRCQAIEIIVKTDKEIAFGSHDHLSPWGTMRDNSRNQNFNNKLYKLFSGNMSPLAVLDLGCSGGGFVRDCINDGCLAVGLEGSNYSSIHRRAEWAVIPEFLFTCDITSDFEVLLKSPDGLKLIDFDVITSWDVLEHIDENDLAKIADNVRKHLKPGGVFISSISPNEEIVKGVKLHPTVHPKKWWVRKFREMGFENQEALVAYFNTQFIRGPKYGAPNSFHLVLNPAGCGKGPAIPKESVLQRILDRWIASRPQRLLRKLLIGN